MLHSRFQPLIAWLCLACFGPGSLLLTGGVVLCRDGQGGSRIEWGCDRTSGGNCLQGAAESPDDDGDVPHGCQDTPVQPGAQSARTAPRSTGELACIPVPTPAAPAQLEPCPPDHPRDRWTSLTSARPPDALVHLRTVVLLV